MCALFSVAAAIKIRAKEDEDNSACYQVSDDLFNSMDTDGSGTLSIDEARALTEKTMSDVAAMEFDEDDMDGKDLQDYVAYFGPEALEYMSGCDGDKVRGEMSKDYWDFFIAPRYFDVERPEELDNQDFGQMYDPGCLGWTVKDAVYLWA